MNDRTSQTPVSFVNWLFKNPANKGIIYASVIGWTTIFILFKLVYPLPNLLPDSYSYIDAAFHNYSINVWPIGYSKFLRAFSCFSKSHTALVFFQYSLLQASILYFLFSVHYWLKLTKRAIWILVACNMANPLNLYVGNFISSDALFAALSITWFTQLLWIIKTPNTRLLISHCLVLLLAFIVRYNALYYPLISILLIMIANRLTLVQRFSTAVSIVLFIGLFIQQTSSKHETVTGVRQFSAFGGWQLASNALFAYAHTRSIDNWPVPAKYSWLHNIAMHHLDSLNKLKHRPDEQLGIYYLWDDKAPLKTYVALKYKKDSTSTSFKRWASVGPLYSGYGLYLIKSNPGAFVRHFLYPNLINYYIPPAEFLGITNMGSDTIGQVVVDWFNLKSNHLPLAKGAKEIKLTDSFTVVLAVVNLIFIISIVAYWYLGGFGLKQQTSFLNTILKWVFLIWIANLAFSVLASPIVLRYQIFPFVVTFITFCLMLDFIIKKSIDSIPSAVLSEPSIV